MLNNQRGTDVQHHAWMRNHTPPHALTAGSSTSSGAIFTPSKNMSAEGTPRKPIKVSAGPKVTPGASFFTYTAPSPRAPFASGSILQKTIMSEWPAPEHHLRPQSWPAKYIDRSTRCISSDSVQIATAVHVSVVFTAFGPRESIRHLMMDLV